MNKFIFFLSGIFLCLPLYSQSTPKCYTDSIQELKQLAGKAYDTYDYNNSIQYSLQVIRLASTKNDFYNLHKGYNGLGVAYEVLEDTIRAKENYQKAMYFAKASKNDTLLLHSYNNLANVLSTQEKTIQMGLKYYEKAIDIANRSMESEDAMTPTLNIAWTHLENHNYDRSLPYLKRAWKLGKKQNDKSIESNLLALFGMYHSGKGEFRESREHFEEAIMAAEEDSLLVEASFAYKEFSKMLVRNQEFEKAYRALQRHQEYREQIFQKEKNHQREVVYGRFQTEEYKKDLAAAQREQKFKDEVLAKTRQVTIVMIISLSIVLIFLILLFRNNRQRKSLIAALKVKNKELTAANNEAQRLSQLKTKFFSTVSHELRTPLYGVVGLTSLLLEENHNERQQEDLKSLKFSADYLLALINDVLQMNKMESNLVQLENTDFNVEELFEGIVSSIKTTRQDHNNIIEVIVDPGIPKNLVGDAMRLSQVIINLVGNAIKFTDNGRVWIRAEQKSSTGSSCHIAFEVGDTGPGIPKDKQQEIFEEFSQLKSNDYNYQGTGLGLPIVKKLLQLFGADIQLSSKEGEGSVFNFEIQFKKGGKTPVPAVDSRKVPKEIPSQILSALIVDDNRINQVVTRRILEQRDFQCHVVASGEAAVEFLREHKVDVVLMDVNMAEMTGIEATKAIRLFNSTLPIIALTAVEVGEMREEILAAGMNDIINKPYNNTEFFNTIYINLLQPVA